MYQLWRREWEFFINGSSCWPGGLEQKSASLGGDTVSEPNIRGLREGVTWDRVIESSPMTRPFYDSLHVFGKCVSWHDGN